MSDQNKSIRKIPTDTVIPYFSASDNLIKDLKLDSIYSNFTQPLYPAYLDTLYHYFSKAQNDSIAAVFMSQYINESGGNPYEKQKNKKGKELTTDNAGYGALQYSDSKRKKKMKEYKSDNYPNSESLRQAEFTNLEFIGDPSVMPPRQNKQFLNAGIGARDSFYNTTSLKDKGKYLTMGFVRPDLSDLKGETRGTLSEVVYNEFIPKMKEKLSKIPYRYTEPKKPLVPSDFYINPIISWKSGGKFGFNKSRLVKNAEAQNKRDMRKKFIKSDRPTYTKPLVKKKQYGGTITSDINVDEVKFNPDLFTSWNSIQTNVIETPYVDYQSKFPRVDNLMSKINSTTPSKSDTPAEEREVKILPFKFDAPSTVTSFVNPYKGKRGSWVNDMKQAYRDAGIKNENAIRMLIAQDALESRWGEAAQGAYNFGNLTTGKSWKGQFVKGKDRDAAGNPISQKFRSYGSTKDYAADKIDFLKRLYDFDENDNIDTFLHKLQGGNKGGRSYAEDKRYKESVLNTYNSFKG